MSRLKILCLYKTFLNQEFDLFEGETGFGNGANKNGN